MSSGAYYASLCLVKVVLPMLLAICILMRQNVISVPYLIFYFLLPFIPLPTRAKLLGWTSYFLLVLLFVSVLNLVGHCVFQVILLMESGNLSYCSKMESMLRQIGFIKLTNIDGIAIVLAIGPDVLLLISSSIMFAIIKKTAMHQLNSSDTQNIPFAVDHNNKESNYTKIGIFSFNSSYVALLFLFLCGAISPSIPNAVYYITFIGGATWWACNKNLGICFVIVCRIVAVLAAFHSFTILAYQTPALQEAFGPNSRITRYLGLTILRRVDCTDPRITIFTDAKWTDFINPAIVLVLYFILSHLKFVKEESKGSEETGEKSLARTFSQRLSQRRLARNPTMSWRSGNRKKTYSDPSSAQGSIAMETTPLLRNVTPEVKYRTSFQTEDQMRPVQQSEYKTPGCMEMIVDAVISVFQLMIRSSYIATNIMMMAWSITYHSWLTFVLLLWASLLWMIPNQRRSMLRSSPYIVIYVEFLLLSQYIFGMNLTEAELPTKIEGVRLDQIGFVKPESLPCVPIMVKTLFTVMFWITMRQYCQEKKETYMRGHLESRDSTAGHTLKSDRSKSSQFQLSKFSHRESIDWLTSFGKFVQKFMTKFWIWFVAISLFVIGITGKRITVFKIVYMGLFLFFILTFQISYKLWRRIMYGFWLTVIIYSMCILVLVYTYQFDNVPKFWETYLHIPNELQLDIGLETFETAELFMRLLAPTFFVVITVVQLHYFHRDFLAISSLRVRGASVSRSGKGSSRSDGSSVQPEESVPPSSEVATDDVPLLGLQKISFRNLRHLSSNEIRILINGLHRLLINIVELIILFLELHMLKIVIFSIMLLSCYNVTATHVILVILCVVALLMGSKVQATVTLVCSIVIAVLLLLTMIYQIQYIQQDKYISNCTEILPDKKMSYIANNPEWLGFRKATEETTLLNLLQGYIAVFSVITFHAVINTRQRIRRQETNKPKPYVLFPGVDRKMADTSLGNCLKYLINYGFFKFGIEVCLITTVGVIGSRMDFYALVYSIWLAVLFGLSRTGVSRLWNSFKVFIAVMICLQYLLVVGVPPGLCLEYPWHSSETLRRLQNWMFLPDPVEPPSAYKILCDVVLLVFVCRQSLGFRIEKRHQLTHYAGGSNNVIIRDYENIDFVNPYNDHMTETKSSLDLVKKGLFSALLWVTLAVTFTAGTSRVNVFSIGYLVGSFIFLWQGNDLYLRRINSILKWWNWLLGYNVFVIVVKALLQIVGCIFMETVQQNACWVVQLLGIGCISKFGDYPKFGSRKGPLLCQVPDSDIGLAWDGLCFSFLLLQRRFFHSYYFFHHIDETKAMTILQSRGAQLIEELRQHQLQEQQDQERKVLEKIRHKMERIKASQQKVSTKPSHYGGDTDSVDGEDPERVATKHIARLSAIRSGDYGMFEDMDDEELDLIKEDEDESSSEGDDTDGKKRFTMSKFLSTALKTDINKAADQALTTEEVVAARPIRGRRASMPASMLRRKSSMSRRPAPPSSVLSAPAASTSRAHLSPHTRSDIGITRRRSTAIYSEPQRTEARSSLPPTEREDDVSNDGIKYDILPKAVKEKITQKLWRLFKVLWAFVESVMVSMIRTLNKISKDYRYVVRVLAQEKREVKKNEEFKRGSRAGVTKIWKPEKEVIIHLREVISTTSPQGSIGRGSPDGSTIPMESPKEDKERLNRPALSTITESEDQDAQSDSIERQRLGRTDSFLPDIRIIAPSQERGLDDDYFVYEDSGSDTETGKEEWSAANSPVWLQLLLATWYAIISHSELVCYFVIFLHQIKSPTFLSLPLPLMVFLWGSLSLPRPTKTFWITLIAYTEVVVIIKCLFQFEILPWNQTLSPENNPFYPPRIIGVEKKPSYASSDLLLLLIIFFHRYMLKSLGLWKSTNEDISSTVNGVERGNYQELYVSDEQKSSNSKEKGSGSDDIYKECKAEMHVNIISEIEDRSDRTSYDDGKSDSSSIAKENEEPCGRAKNRLKKTFTCVTGEDSDIVDDDRAVYPRYSHGTFENFPNYIHDARNQYCSTTKNFFAQLLDTGSRLSADVYAYMFICDFFNFLVVLFGFSAFGTQQGDGGVSAYLEENKVPIPFLLMMILQFALIVIDRALYLRKYILGKIIFQFILVIGVHIWMFLVLPAITERPFNQLLPPQMWYMVKCFYLLMSAYQIRAGYPTRILGNFLCKKFNYINYFSYKGFICVPFLFELRALMDWMWTDTSMTVWDWLKMEDIFSQIFQLKCTRRAETAYPLPRGSRKNPITKYILGGAGLFLIIAIIWFPLVLFALGNTVGESNLPYDVTVSLRIGAYQYIYEMSAQNNTIYKYSENDFDEITNLYKRNRDREAVTFLSNYQFDDVAVVKLSENSTTVWGISPPDRRLLLQEVESNQTVSVKFRWRISRLSNNPDTVGIVNGERQIFLPPFVNGERNPKRVELANMLKSSTNSSQKSIVIENILPKFLKIANKGSADPISKFMVGDSVADTYRNISISLRTGQSIIGTIQQWWEVREMCNDDNYINILSRLPLNECNLFMTIFTFNDKAFPATLSFISGKGIIGLYVSIVFVASTLIRQHFIGVSNKIMFEDMPNVDRILQLCLDIYLVRESREFALEEDLFAKLVFLYRSPETIIKWTKMRKEPEEEELGDGSQIPSVEN